MRICFSIIGLLWSLLAYSQSLVHVKFSKPFAVIKFLQTAINSHGTSVTFKHQIDTSFLSKEAAFQDLVEDYQSLQLDYNYVKQQYPSNRKHTTSTWDLLCVAAISSDNNQELFDRIIGIYPNTDYLKLKDILTKAEPYYDRFIYNRYKLVIEDKVRELNGLSPQLNTLFEKFKTFYGSSWDKSMPFNLTIYPIIGRHGQTTATPHANCLEMGILTQEEDVFGLLSIGMHEMSHVLFEEQPLLLQQQLDSTFTDSITPFTKFAYHYIDEALATALGNGYAYKELAGESDSSEWYNDIYINAYAKAIFPLVEEYVNNKQQIDKAFIIKAMVLFEQTFPKALYDFDPLLMTSDIYFEDDVTKEIDDMEAVLHSAFRIYSSNMSIPINDKLSLDNIKHSKETQIIIIHKNQAQILAKLKLIFKNLATVPLQKNMVISFLDKNKRAIIIVVAENKAKAIEGIKLLKIQKEINPKKLWVTF
ncbi:MAG: hypothetical protein HY062_15870 [Bacteroidetes bacterium]|nr:hypothetical protein [Bacteroidota bacterium]